MFNRIKSFYNKVFGIDDSLLMMDSFHHDENANPNKMSNWSQSLIQERLRFLGRKPIKDSAKITEHAVLAFYYWENEQPNKSAFHMTQAQLEAGILILH